MTEALVTSHCFSLLALQLETRRCPARQWNSMGVECVALHAADRGLFAPHGGAGRATADGEECPGSPQCGLDHLCIGRLIYARMCRDVGVRQARRVRQGS